MTRLVDQRAAPMLLLQLQATRTLSKASHCRNIMNAADPRCPRQNLSRMVETNWKSGIFWVMPARVALAGEVIPLKDEKGKVITEDLRESVLLEEKAINEASYTVSALLSSARISCRLRSEKFQEMLNQSSNYVVYKLNVELGKAETEVVALKQQLEAGVQKNSALEDRIGHQDGALKECIRQLRQLREDQELKIQEALVKKTHEWESEKS